MQLESLPHNLEHIATTFQSRPPPMREARPRNREPGQLGTLALQRVRVDDACSANRMRPTSMTQGFDISTFYVLPCALRPTFTLRFTPDLLPPIFGLVVPTFDSRLPPCTFYLIAPAVAHLLWSTIYCLVPVF